MGHLVNYSDVSFNVIIYFDKSDHYKTTIDLILTSLSIWSPIWYELFFLSFLSRARQILTQLLNLILTIQSPFYAEDQLVMWGVNFFVAWLLKIFSNVENNVLFFHLQVKYFGISVDTYRGFNINAITRYSIKVIKCYWWLILW